MQRLLLPGSWIREGCLALAAVLSCLLGTPEVALASAAAFTVSETTDWLVFAITRLPFADRVFSTVVSAPVDTAVFLGLAELLTWPLFLIGVTSKSAADFGVWALLRRRSGRAAR